MIWSLKSHTEMLFSIELELASCSRPIDMCPLERWKPDLHQKECSSLERKFDLHRYSKYGYRLMWFQNYVLCYLYLLLWSCCQLIPSHHLVQFFFKGLVSRLDALVLLILDRILTIERVFFYWHFWRNQSLLILVVPLLIYFKRLSWYTWYMHFNTGRASQKQVNK